MKLIGSYIELLEKIVVPPRRGARGMSMFVRRQLKKFRDAKRIFDGHIATIGDADQFDVRGLFNAMGVNFFVVSRTLTKELERFEELVGTASEAYLASKPMTNEHYEHLLVVKRAWEHHPFSPYSHPGQESARVTDEVNRLAGIALKDVKAAQEEEGLEWYPKYEEGLSPKVISSVAELATATKGILQLSQEAKDRLEALRVAERDQGVRSGVSDLIGTEKTEQLYHASLSARDLYTKGFSANVPDVQGGLGGAQNAGGRSKGTSFTYDLYVAKEIARTLKDLVLIAKGKVTARDVLKWAVRERVIKDMESDIGGLREMRGLTFSSTKRGWSIRDREGKAKDALEVFGAPEVAVWIFKIYLRHMRDKRYDPYIMNPHRIVSKLKRTKMRDVGVVLVTVDMSHPDIKHLGSERELRVPPEAIISVDKLIR